MLTLLLSCDLTGRVRCDTAREVEDRAWSEAVDWYARMGAQAEQTAAEKERALRGTSSDREAANSARSTYTQRSRGGLVDLRYGQVRSTSEATSLNRGRAAAAARRIEEAADAEALAAADWVEAARYARHLSEAEALARAIQQGHEPLERAEELRDTTLIVEAVQARLDRQSACGEGSR